MNIVELIKVNLKIVSLFFKGCKVETSDFRRSYKFVAPFYDNEWYIYLYSVTDEIFENVIDIQTPDYILDLGCGTGGSTLMLREYFPGSHITALDFSKYMLKYAKAKLHDSDVLLVRDSIEKGLKKFKDSQFDLIVCAWSLGYARNKKVFRELHRVLSDKGHLLILTNKQDTLKEVQQAMKYTMFKHYDLIGRLPLHKFPKDKDSLMSRLGKDFKEIKSGEGSFSISISSKPVIIDWLLKSGIMAGYEFVLELRRYKSCRRTFEEYISANFQEVTHNYMWLLVQKQ